MLSDPRAETFLMSTGNEFGGSAWAARRVEWKRHQDVARVESPHTTGDLVLPGSDSREA